jgi:SET domain-containing protein
MRKQGASNVMEFLFNTMSKNRYIDGTQGSNTLSYVNTGQLLDYPRIAENNLAIIHVENNFAFYVAIKPIAQGEELFIDYGPNYIGREQIKVEAE